MRINSENGELCVWKKDNKINIEIVKIDKNNMVTSSENIELDMIKAKKLADFIIRQYNKS